MENYALKLYETRTLIERDAQAAGTEDVQFHVISGSRLLVSLSVSALSIGATMTVEVQNNFNEGVAWDTLATVSATSVGLIKRVFSDFHNLFKIRITIAGGTATYKLGVTLYDNALATKIENATVDVNLNAQLDDEGRFDSVRIFDSEGNPIELTIGGEFLASDEGTHTRLDNLTVLVQTEFDETQTILVALGDLIQAESDQTQTILQSEFDATQVQLDQIIANQTNDTQSTKIVSGDGSGNEVTVDGDKNLHVEMHGNDGSGTDTVLLTDKLGHLSIDGVYDATNNTDPSNIGMVLQTRNATAADSRQVERVTAKRGTTDTDVVSQDMSLHDHDGNQYTLANPVPTLGSNGSVAVAFGAGITDGTVPRAASNTHDGVGNPITSSAVNSNRLLHIQAPDTTTAATALGALNAEVVISMEGLDSVGFQLNAGTFRGTIVAESSVDGGTSWVAIPFYDSINRSVLPSKSFTVNNPLTILSIVPIGGSSHVRVRVSAYTSGTANALLRGSNVNGAAGALSSSSFGVVVNTYPTLTAGVPTLVLASNPNRKYAYISNNAAVVISMQLGSGTGLNASTGLRIASKGFQELKGENLYTGDIYAFSTTAVSISVTEGTP